MLATTAPERSSWRRSLPSSSSLHEDSRLHAFDAREKTVSAPVPASTPITSATPGSRNTSGSARASGTASQAGTFSLRRAFERTLEKSGPGTACSPDSRRSRSYASAERVRRTSPTMRSRMESGIHPRSAGIVTASREKTDQQAIRRAEGDSGSKNNLVATR